MIDHHKSSWLDMINYGHIAVFDERESLDLAELGFLLGLALRDGSVDEAEKNALRTIFHKIEQSNVPPKVWDRMAAIREKYLL